MKNQSQKLIQDINRFLAKNIRAKKPITDPDDLVSAFFKDFPEYKESYEKEIIVAEIDLILSTTIL